PRLVEAEAETKRVNLLAHSLSFFPRRPRKGPPYFSFLACAAFSFLLGVVADFSARARFGRGASAPGAVPTATTFSARSATCTVRCAVRFSTRNARPIGAGRTRLADGPWFA